MDKILYIFSISLIFLPSDSWLLFYMQQVAFQRSFMHMSNLFALFKIIWMSPEWNVPRSLVTWWLKRKFAVDNGRRSIRMEEQINQSFAIRMNNNLKLNSFFVPLFSHIMICIFSHLNVWLVGTLYWVTCSALSGTSVTWAAVTCCLWGLATKQKAAINHPIFFAWSLSKKSAAKVGILDQPGVLSQSQFFFSSNRPKLSDTEILTFWQSQYFVVVTFSALDLVGGSSELWEGARCLVM